MTINNNLVNSTYFFNQFIDVKKDVMLNNKMLSMMIQAGYEGRGHCRIFFTKHT